jgi:hypothetical protein
MTEKTRLTYAYIQHSYQFYRNARQKLRDLFERLTEAGARRVVFYGATDLAEIAFVSMQETPVQLAAVVDDQKVGRSFFGHTIHAPKALEDISFDKILITDLKGQQDVVHGLTQMGIGGDQIALFE